MRKRILFSILPVFLFAFVVALASCNNAYAGNYKEVSTTSEEFTKVDQKLNAISAEEEKAQTKKGYETIVDAKVKIETKSNNQTSVSNATLKSTAVVVEANTYSEAAMTMNATGEQAGNMNANMKQWSDNQFVYVDYSIKGSANGEVMDEAKKVKLSFEDKDLVDELIPVSDQMFQSINKEVDLNTAITALKAAGAKVYVDGESKIKLEMPIPFAKDVVSTMYILINADNTYQIKLEVPEYTFDMSSLGMGSLNLEGLNSSGLDMDFDMPEIKMTMSYTVELKPTTRTITMPNANDFELMA